jgi:hypothetical protein
LNKLNIVNKQQEKINTELNSYNANLIIPQSNGYDIEFTWNGKEYELVVDMSFGNNLIQSKVLSIKLHNNMPVKLLLVRVKRSAFNQLNINKMLMDQIH